MTPLRKAGADQPAEQPTHGVTRRDFLRVMLRAAGGAVAVGYLGGCAPAEEDPAPTMDVSSAPSGTPMQEAAPAIVLNPEARIPEGMVYPAEVLDIDFGAHILVPNREYFLETKDNVAESMLGHLQAHLAYEKMISGDTIEELDADLFEKYHVHLSAFAGDGSLLVLQKKATGEFMVPRLTAGEEAGQLCRDLMIPRWVVDSPIGGEIEGHRYFEFTLIKASEPGADMATHWPILVNVNWENTPTEWYNADLGKFMNIGPAPTETAEPRPIYATEAVRPKDFSVHESLRPIQQDVIDHPLLAEPGPVDFNPFRTDIKSSRTAIIFRCKYGITCIDRAYVRVGEDHYIVWEIRNPGDKQSRSVTTYVGGNSKEANYIQGDIMAMLDQINMYKQGRGVGLDFYLVTTLYKTFDNPALNTLLLDRPPEQQKEVDTFEDDHIITDAMQYVPVWLSRIDPNFL